MILRPAVPSDYAFVRALVCRPENQHYLTDEDEAALGAYATSADSRLLILQTETQDQAGFALFCEVGKPSGTVELRRLALSDAGQGRGTTFLRLLIAYAFQDLQAARLWLDASSENLRAQKVYEAVGFTLEGRLRQHSYCAPIGRNVDTMLYGMMRAEWPG